MSFFQLLTWTRQQKSVSTTGQNVVKFDSDLLKTKEDIALQSRRIYRRLCSGGGGGGLGVGAKLCLSL